MYDCTKSKSESQSNTQTCPDGSVVESNALCPPSPPSQNNNNNLPINNNQQSEHGKHVLTARNLMQTATA